MGLTTENFLGLKNAKADKYVEKNKAMFTAMAEQAFRSVREYIDAKYDVRRADVAEQLDRAFRVNEKVLAALVNMKLRAKIWSRYLADYVVEQVWEEIGGESKKGQG